jgi:hypothetical protein
MRMSVSCGRGAWSTRRHGGVLVPDADTVTLWRLTPSTLTVVRLSVLSMSMISAPVSHGPARHFHDAV